VPTLARRLLLGSGGGFEVPDMPLSASETEFWQDQSALLDPDAYVHVQGTSQSFTVPGGERAYILNAWFCQTFDDGGGDWFHRDADVNEAYMLPEGHTIETSASEAASFFYYCRPSLVTGSGAYQTDPRGLYFERIQRLGLLDRYQVGAANSGAGQSDVAFDVDFTDGLIVHVSSHDVAWVILVNATNGGALNTLNEISDTTRIRFAETCLFPFKRTTFPEIRIQGVSLAEGAANVTYVKLPGDW
jgi:hypothetical protein